MKAIYFVVAIGVFIQTGCVATAGTARLQDHAARAQVASGQTQAQVQTLLGAPGRKTVGAAGGELWEYSYARTEALPAAYVPLVGLFGANYEVTLQTMAVDFTQAGVVRQVVANKTVTRYDGLGRGTVVAAP